MCLNKTIVIVILGTLLEWMEFSFFAYMTDYLSGVFFPIDSPDFARLKIYGAFAASYLMRPVGAIFFGYLGDKYGRKLPMIMSLIVMGISTFAIGVLPPYQSIGSVAPILLVVFRMLQGFAVGGEFNGSTVILTEYDKAHPFSAGAWTPFASTAGMVLGSCMATLVLSFSYYDTELWRVPFLLSSFLAFAAIYWRKYMRETKDFLAAKKSNSLFKLPIIAAWKFNRAGLLCTAALSMFISVYVYTGNVYYKTIAVTIGGASPEKAGLAISCGISLSMLLIPIFAKIADRTDGYRLCFISIILAISLSPIIMFLASVGDFRCVLVGQMIYGVIDALTSATVYTVLTAQFETGTKYSGASFAWSVATAFFGGTALIANEFLVSMTRAAWCSGFYMSMCALVCLVVLKKFAMKKSLRCKRVCVSKQISKVL